MSKAAKKIRIDPGEVREPSEAEERLDRSQQLIDREAVHEALLDIFNDIEKGFDRQCERSDALMDYWDVFNCVLGPRQVYNGNSQIFTPIVHSAIEARKTRFTNQLFPKNGRYVEAVTSTDDIPYAETALLEHYIRLAKLRTQVCPALIKNGDIEGQCTIQVTWEEFRRHVAQRVKTPIKIEDMLTDEDTDEIIEEELIDGRPVVSVIADPDLLVLPSTANSIEEALRDGGSVTTICRWSEAKIERMIAMGEIDEDEGDDLLHELRQDDKNQQRRDKPKEMVDAAGIKWDGRGKFALVYRTWTYLTLDGERRLCLAYYGGVNRVLSCKRNPYWSDRIDIISCPIDKVDGSFKGRSKLEFGVADMQYQANDAVNEGMDSAAYALLPIIMTDPEKNPKVGQMVMTLAAVWETSPNDTQFAKFPELWKDAFEIVAVAKNEIFQALSVNPAQITGATNPNKKRPSQAELANEQQVDLLTTADAVTMLEDEIFSPMVTFMLELDHQYRTKPVRVREFGPIGMKQEMSQVPLIQMDKTYSFRWFGVEQARNAQMLQQQVALINVVKGIPAQMYPKYKLDMGPVIAQAFENTFGPRLTPLILRSQSDELSIDPQIENQLMGQGFTVPVHMEDDFQKHMQAHQQAMQTTGDPDGRIKVHMMAHLNAQQAKQQQAMQQGGPQGPGGPPGGGGPQGGPGGPQGPGGQSPGPRPGATPGQPRQQGPPGSIHQDQMVDPSRMPR